MKPLKIQRKEVGKGADSNKCKTGATKVKAQEKYTEANKVVIKLDRQGHRGKFLHGLAKKTEAVLKRNPRT